MSGLWLPDGSYHSFAAPGARPTVGEIISRARSADSLSWWFGLLPDPDPILTKLGLESSQAFWSLLFDSRVGACVESRKSATLSKELLVSPGGDGGRAEEKAADEAREMVSQWGQGRQGMHDEGGLARTISEILDAPLWGCTPLEVIWESEGRAWRIADLVGKPAWWFRFDDKNELKFISRDSPTDGEAMPPYKLLLPRHNPSYHNPYGQRLLSRLFWPVTFKRAGWRLWAEFIEKFGGVFLLGKSPPNTSSDDRQKLATEMANMLSGSVLVYPDGGEVATHEASGKGSSSLVYRQFIENCNADISVVILGGTLTQEITGQGSRAAAEIHFKVRDDLAERDQALVVAAINRALGWWAEFNHPGVAPPICHFHEEEDLQKDRAERDEILARQALNFKKPYYVREYSLPEEDFDLAESAPAPALSAAAPPGQVVALAEGGEPAGAPTDIRAWLEARAEALDGLVESARKLAGTEGLIKQILAVVDEAQDLEGVGELLCQRHPEIDFGELAEGVERAVFAAEMYGRWAVDQEIAGDHGPKLAASWEISPEPLPMKEAVEFWESKVKVSPGIFKRLPEEARLRAFAVAGIAKGDALTQVWGELHRALDEGASLGEFKKGCREIFERRGWTGPAAHRADVIFRNNVLTAYAVGRHSQMTDPDVLSAFPSWMYVAVRDDRTRPSHAAMDGRVFRADDPIWDEWDPPNGHNCRCEKIAMSDRQVGKRGLRVEDGRGILRGEPQPLPGPDGQPSGLVQIIQPDPGWAFSPGKAAWGGHIETALKKTSQKEWEDWPRPLPGHDAYRLPAARNIKKLDKLPPLLPDQKVLKKRGWGINKIGDYYHENAIKELSLEAGERQILAPDGQTLILSPRFWGGSGVQNKLIKDRGQYIPVFKSILEAPDEIWLTPMIEKTTREVILRRRHFKFWRGEEENIAGFAVMDFDRNVCTGVTIYGVKESKEALDARYRRGALLWLKEKKK